MDMVDNSDLWLRVLSEVCSVEELGTLYESVYEVPLESLCDESVDDCNGYGHNELGTKDIEESYIAKYHTYFDQASEGREWNEFLRDILCPFGARIIEAVENCQIAGSGNGLTISFLRSLFEECYQMSIRVLVEEYEKERSLLLDWNDERGAENEYNRKLKNSQYQKQLFIKYRELKRLIIVRSSWFCDYVEEILDKTEKNIEHIRAMIDPGAVVLDYVDMDAGDSHNGGRRVCVLHFSGDVKIVCKPRSQESEKAFEKTLGFINRCGAEGYRKLEFFHYVGDKDFLWSEFVAHTECRNREDVRDYFVRLGEILCILYLFGAKDIHSENIVARGGQPIVIDLETLFHDITFQDGLVIPGACRKALDIVNNSVMKTGMLPAKIVNPKQGKALSVGVMGSQSEQESPFGFTCVRRDASGKMTVTTRYGMINSENCHPCFEGTVFNAIDHIDEVMNGFEYVYDYISDRKEEFIRMIVQNYGHINGRVLIRSTNIYSQLLRTGYNPVMLQDSRNRRVLFLKLHYLSNAVADDIQKNEIKALMNGDVPFFSNTYDKRFDLRGYEEPSLLDNSVNRIKEMNPKDKKRQVGLIRVSFLDDLEAVGADIYRSVRERSLPMEVACITDETDYVHILKRLIELLKNQSISAGSDQISCRTWLGVIRQPNWPTYVTFMGPEIYSGLMGIEFALDKCREYCPKLTDILRQMSDEVYSDVTKSIELVVSQEIMRPGAYTGWFGILYVMMNDHRRDDLRIMRLLENTRITRFQRADIMEGAAGVLKVLVFAWNRFQCKKTPSSRCSLNIWHLISECITYLKESAVSDGKLLFWDSEGYVGYSHGAAGIVDALTDYYVCFKDADVLPMIEGGVLYVKSKYVAQLKNWSRSINEERVSKGWCHGAPGIELMMINLYQTFGERYFSRQEVADTANTILSVCLENDFCLCHGDMGNLLIVKYAAKCLDDGELLQRCKGRFNDCVERIRSMIFSDFFYYTENWSLMLGVPSLIAGIIGIAFEADTERILYLR